MHSSASLAANGGNSVSSAWDAPNRPRVSFRSQERTERLRHHLGDRNQSQWRPDLALATRVDLAVGIHHLCTARRDCISAGSGCGSGPTIDNGATGRRAGHAGITHRRQGTANPRLRHGNKSAVDRRFLAPEESTHEACDDRGQYDQFAGRDAHFFAPADVPGGSSSNSTMTSESRFALVASAGGLNTNASASATASVFQSLILSVYCGAPVTVLLVITYFRGTGRAPLSIQICQSVSTPRNARCSHSTPSITPCPM